MFICGDDGRLEIIDLGQGIAEETLSNPSVDLYTGEDGGAMTLKDTYVTEQTEIDLTTEVATVGAGKWINVQFRPNKRMRIEANAHVKLFISSDWDFITSTLIADQTFGQKEDEFRGSDCSGSDGTTNRILTLSGAPNGGIATISINGTSLHKGAALDYTIAGAAVTFKNLVWDTDYIRAVYFK